MALTVWHCGGDRSGRVYRLISNDPRFAFQVLIVIKKCKGNCKGQVLRWFGEFQSGKVTDKPFEIKTKEHKLWLERIKVDGVKPELQCTGDYTLLIKNDPANVYEQVLGRTLGSQRLNDNY